MANILPVLLPLMENVAPDRVRFSDVSDEELFKATRLPRYALEELKATIEPKLKRATDRSFSLDAETQILAALTFFSSGSFQWMTGRSVGISQSSVSRCIEAVSDALCDQADKWIKFPVTPSELIHSKKKFYDLARLPNIVGSIDGTHIPIIAPSDHGETFLNRKGFHSMNVQAVCDAELRFIDICAKFPGSCHDSYIWRNSGLRNKFSSGLYQDCMLVGDSGYALEPWLLTPVLSPSTQAEERYNTAHAMTRNVIERAFGVLKSRFRCLDKSGGTLLYHPLKSCKILLACCVLHNYCLNNKLDVPQGLSVYDDDDDDDDDDDSSSNAIEQTESAVNLRKAIINRFN